MDIRAVITIFGIAIAMFVAFDTFLDRARASITQYDKHIFLHNSFIRSIVSLVKNHPDGIKALSNISDVNSAYARQSITIRALLFHAANIAAFEGSESWIRWKHHVVSFRNQRETLPVLLGMLVIASLIWLMIHGFAFLSASENLKRIITTIVIGFFVLNLSCFLYFFYSYFRLQRSSSARQQIYDDDFYKKLIKNQ